MILIDLYLLKTNSYFYLYNLKILMTILDFFIMDIFLLNMK